MIDRRRRTAALFPDNAALLRACQDGDAVAWSEIVDRYERLVYAIPLKEGLTFDDAADVTQETFTALMTSLHQIRQPERLGWWLMTVARRLSWRERHRSTNGELDLAGVDVEDESSASDDWATVEWVYDAIESLAEPCRSLVVALFFDPAEPSYAEIAVRLGRPVGSVGPLRARCLQRLRAVLDGTE